MACTPTCSSASRSTPYFPTVTLESISVEARTLRTFVRQSSTQKPMRRPPSTMGSVTMPPTTRSSASSISMTFRRA